MEDVESKKRYRHYESSTPLESDGRLKRRFVGIDPDANPIDVPIPEADDVEKQEGLLAFMAERVAIDSRLNKNQKKQAAGKTLNYSQCDEFTRSGLDQARQAEWDKWKQFDAGTIVRGKDLRDLISQGHKIIPTQWIEVDKNSHLKQSGNYKGPEFKSRLVACGQFEDASELRTDSPTCDVEGLNLILALAASRTNRLQSADVRNAYFQGKKLERTLLLRPPRGGLPGEENEKDSHQG